MKTIRVIDLLNKIANGEEVPKEIKYNGEYWHLKQDYSNRLPYYSNGIDMDNFFTGKEGDYFSHSLNNEVEIIEEKKIPEKITMRAGLVGDINNKLENLDINQMEIEDTLNEIIDYLDYLKSKGE